MGKVTSHLKILVIQKYLNGLSLNDIAKEISISKGSVSNLIKAWKASMLGIGIEEVRAFASEVRKSGMTIPQCAEGFRTAQILKKFGIKDAYDDYAVEDEEEEDNKELKFNTNDTENALFDYNTPHETRQKIAQESDDKYLKRKNNEISYFLGVIYKHCKKNEIRPTS